MNDLMNIYSGLIETQQNWINLAKKNNWCFMSALTDGTLIEISERDWLRAHDKKWKALDNL